MQRRSLIHAGLAFSGLFTTASTAEIKPANNKNTSDIEGKSPALKATDQDLMHLRRSIELSDLAPSQEYGGNPPFGAILVLADGSVHEGWNHVFSNNDPTHHAELWLITKTIKELNLDWRGKDAGLLNGATLYASTEPCAMCAGAMYWSGIQRLVYGCSAECFGSIFKSLFPARVDTGLSVSSRSVFASSGRKIETIGPVLEEKASRIHKRHWPEIFGIESPFI